jgi:hypothetical protein
MARVSTRCDIQLNLHRVVIGRGGSKNHLLFPSPAINLTCEAKKASQLNWQHRDVLLFLISFSLRRMTGLCTQFYHRTIDEVIQSIVCEERLRLRDLNLMRTTLPYALVVGCDGIFQGCRAGMYGFEGLDKAVRRVESVIGSLTTICLELSAACFATRILMKTYGKSWHVLHRRIMSPAHPGYPMELSSISSTDLLKLLCPLVSTRSHSCTAQPTQLS